MNVHGNLSILTGKFTDDELFLSYRNIVKKKWI